jgi:PHD/YefM family antitoxin component YafN of YafNO toxin-antitoxin module
MEEHGGPKMTMQKVPSLDAQNEFQFVMDQVCSGLGPVLITGMRGNAVLVSEQEWRRLHQNLEALAISDVENDALDQLEQIVEAHSGHTAHD